MIVSRTGRETPRGAALVSKPLGLSDFDPAGFDIRDRVGEHRHEERPRASCKPIPSRPCSCGAPSLARTLSGALSGALRCSPRYRLCGICRGEERWAPAFDPWIIGSIISWRDRQPSPSAFGGPWSPWEIHGHDRHALAPVVAEPKSQPRSVSLRCNMRTPAMRHRPLFATCSGPNFRCKGGNPQHHEVSNDCSYKLHP